MNSIGAILLCVMPEVDAYFCYRKIIKEYVPTYFCRAKSGNSGMEGGTSGVAVRFSFFFFFFLFFC